MKAGAFKPVSHKIPLVTQNDKPRGRFESFCSGNNCSRWRVPAIRFFTRVVRFDVSERAHGR